MFYRRISQLTQVRPAEVFPFSERSILGEDAETPNRCLKAAMLPEDLSSTPPPNCRHGGDIRADRRMNL
ncbi:MAG: hypothetical protein ACOYKZ_07895 [Chlamydiia bacterium]